MRKVYMVGTIDVVATLGPATSDSLGDAIVPVSSTGSGYLSGLGAVTMTESHTTTILAASRYKTSLVMDGRATITDAAGDQLFLVFGGAGVFTEPSQFDDTFVYTVTGGTGRFAGASGDGFIRSTDEPGTATEVPFVLNVDGVVLTVGSGSSCLGGRGHRWTGDGHQCRMPSGYHPP